MSSIIDRNINQLGTKFLENLKYQDLDYRTGSTPDFPPTLEGSVVLVNDLRLWLQATEGDYYRRPNQGGFFDTNLREHPLTPSGEASVAASLTRAINQEFPSIAIINLEVIADVVRRGWVIHLTIKDTLTGTFASFTEGYEVPE